MSDPLREAARDVVIQRGRYYRDGVEDPELSVVPRVALRRLDVALALSAVSVPTPLDVERLALAIIDVNNQHLLGQQRILPVDAERLAAAYDRAPQPVPEEPSGA